MNRYALLSWLLSLIFVAVTAGSTWKDIDLSAEVGSAEIIVTGLDVYPIAGAVILFQLAALSVVSLISRIPARIIQALVASLSLALFVFVIPDWSIQTQKASIQAISDAIGVAGQTVQGQLVVLDKFTLWPVIFLVALILNSLIVLLGALSSTTTSRRDRPLESTNDTDHLWESQKP